MSDPVECLAAAVEHLIEAAMRSKRQESVAFWESIEKAREQQREARRALADVLVTPLAAD